MRIGDCKIIFESLDILLDRVLCNSAYDLFFSVTLAVLNET